MRTSLYPQDSHEWGAGMATACNLSPSEVDVGIGKLWVQVRPHPNISVNSRLYTHEHMCVHLTHTNEYLEICLEIKTCNGF